MMEKSTGFLKIFKKYDFSYFGTAIAIFLIGIINLYSATYSSAHLAGLCKLQLIWFLLGMIVSVAISFLKPSTFFRFAYVLYFLNLILLVLVLVLGHKGMGAQRWLVIGSFRIQPSELMKISIILALARWYSRNCLDGEMGLKDLLIPFFIAIVPIILIAAEPDLGTGLLVLLIFLMISFYRRLKWKTIVFVSLLGLACGTFTYQFGLKSYQQKRILTYLNPGSDTRGSGYNAIQSKIAIGSGQFIGKGFKKSSQASLNYLPENHTDFVFSVFNEEHGFFGSLVLISLYIILFYRFYWLITCSTRLFDSIVITGLLALFYGHTFINMGMVTGLLPIVGLPLPLMSYGGSSLLTFCVCCGLATSISNARRFF